METKTRTATVTVTEEMAAEIERTTYLYRGRKDIIKTILRDREENYNTELLDYYQKLYDEAYLKFRQMVEYVNTYILKEFTGRFRWMLEYSTCTIQVYMEEKEEGAEA